jgi:hypothetical protein
MAFTASIVKKGVVDKSFLVAVSYDNGAGFQFIEQIDMTGSDLQNLNNIIVARLNTLNTTVSLIPQVTTGPFTPTTTTKTQAQIDQETFLSDYRTLRSMKSLIDLGVKTTADADYVALVAKVTAELLPTYYPFFS